MKTIPVKKKKPAVKPAAKKSSKINKKGKKITANVEAPPVNLIPAQDLIAAWEKNVSGVGISEVIYVSPGEPFKGILQQQLSESLYQIPPDLMPAPEEQEKKQEVEVPVLTPEPSPWYSRLWKFLTSPFM